MSNIAKPNLVMNQGAPMLAPTGGSVANATANVGNSLAALFAPGSGNIGPSAPILDPFAGQLHSRFEVPDTAGTFNLGDVVVYMMMSDGEDFYTRDICPIVEWDWAIRRITYGTWVFPQYAIHPTPETAPPRYVESYMFNDTTTLTRYATGHHMSVEYMNTARGQHNQLCTLKQLAYNIQETQNICVINALMNCKRRLAERREILGSYTLVDLEEEFKNEVSRFCRVQKEEFGFLTMWEEILREMARMGGKADSVIITKRVNSLVVTRPEYTKYMEAGPSGPATVRDPNRSFLPAGVNAYFSNTYPERFGSKLGPWQQWLQIGTYAQSRELSVLTSRSDEYFKNYDSKTRSVWLYDLNVDKFVEVDVKKMIVNCALFDPNGKLRTPSTGRSFTASGKHIKDFLTMDSDSLWSDNWRKNPFQGHNLSGGGGGGGGGNSGGGFSGRIKAGRSGAKAAGIRSRDDGVISVSLIGHLQEHDFGVENFQDCGAMILHRIAEMNGCSAQNLVAAIQQGLSLYADMSRRPIDRDFIDFVIRNAIVDMYGSERPIKPSPTGHKSVWIDEKAQDIDEVWENVENHCLQYSSEKGKKKIMLKNVFEHNLCLPLPYQELQHDTMGDKSFSNLTGYQSFSGFCEMAKLFKSGSQIAHLQKRYNMKELEIASNFVDAMEMFAQGLESILPECVLFSGQSESNNTLSTTHKAKLICEKIFNMGGSNIWVDLKNYGQFLKTGSDVVDNGDDDDDDDGNGPPKDTFPPEASQFWGDWYGEVTQTVINKWLEKHGLRDVETMVQKYIETMDPKDWKQIVADFHAKFSTEAKITNQKALKGLETFLADSKKLAEMVTYWVTPNLKRTQIKPGSFPLGPPSSNNNLLVEIETLYDLYGGVGPNAPHLSADNSWLGTNCVLMSGHTRLYLVRLALMAVLRGIDEFKNNPQKFMALLWDLNLLMAPTHSGVFGELDEVATLKIFRKELRRVVKKNPNIGGPIGKISLGSMTLYAHYLRQKLIEYFGKDSMFLQGVWDNIKAHVERERDYATSLLSLLQDTQGDTHVIDLPLLRDIGIQSMKFDTAPGKMSGLDFLKEVVVPISHILNIDPPDGILPAQQANTGAKLHSKQRRPAQNIRVGKSQIRRKNDDDYVTIGPKQGPELFFDPDPWDVKQNNTSPKSTSSSGNPSGGGYFKTSLVFSSEQILQLKSHAVGVQHQFEVTPTDPGDYFSYVDPTKLKHLHQLITNTMTKTNYTDDPNQQPHWREIPLLHVEAKLKNTFFGAPMEEAHDGGCGLPIGSVLNKSFTQTCFKLDRSKCPAAVKMGALLYMSTAINMNTLLALAASNVRIPMNFILARPHRNFITESCAILSTGEEKLGFTVMACRDYITGQTVLTKEWAGHVSFMTNTIITHPENCYIQQNIMVTGFGTGQGVRFWNNPQSYGPGDQCGSERPDPHWPSMFCFAVPFTEVVDRTYINTPGQIPHLVEAIQSTQIKVSEEARRARHYSTADRYNELWKFHKMTDSRLMSIMGANGGSPLYNTQCYQDTCGYWDPYRKDVKYMTLGTGHLGKNIGPGFKDVMEGKVIRFKDYGYECNPSLTIV